MKYIWFWEFDSEDIYDMFEIDNQMAEERKRHPDKYPKVIFGAHFLGMENKGITIYETDDPRQLANLAIKFFPEKKTKFVPIFEKDYVKKTHLEMRKQ